MSLPASVEFDVVCGKLKLTAQLRAACKGLACLLMPQPEAVPDMASCGRGKLTRNMHICISSKAPKHTSPAVSSQDHKV